MLLEHPLLRLDHVDQVARRGETIQGDAGQGAVVTHPVDVDEVVAIPRPDTVGRDGQPPFRHGARLDVIRHPLGGRGHVFAHQAYQQHQGDSRLERRHDDADLGAARCLHHHQLGAGRQLAEANEAPQQGRQGEEEHRLLGHGEQHEVEGVEHVVVALPHGPELLHILDERRQPDQGQFAQQDRHEDDPTDVSIENAEHQPRPLSCSFMLISPAMRCTRSASKMTRLS